MGRLDELRSGDTEWGPALRDGLETLSFDQEMRFDKYTRVVLPLDGYIFWQPMEESVSVKCSFHFSQEIQQDEDETYGAISVSLTSFEPVVEFEAMPPDTLYVGQIRGVKFAFFTQTGFYGPAKLWHYMGRSIPPVMLPQLLDTPGAIDAAQPVTSNSLALWIAANTYKLPPLYFGLPKGFTLYPADMVPPNLAPPYGVVKIEDTRPLQAIPGFRGGTIGTDQLDADRVRVTLNGLQHNDGVDFLSAILAYSRYSDNFGLMNSTTVTDGSRKEASLQAVGMQKFILMEVSFKQSRVNDITRALIKKAVPSYQVGSFVVPS